MKWVRAGEFALHCGPWRIARCLVGGVPRYCLTRDGDEYRWCGVRLQRARYFDSSAAAKQVALDEMEAEHEGEHGIDR